jgi:CheY-like chemotaxis protein
LALVDLKMPVMDGYEFARRLKDTPDYRAVRLVALTGATDARAYLRTWALGFDGHLEKPVTLEKMDNLARFFSGPTAGEPSAVT